MAFFVTNYLFGTEGYKYRNEFLLNNHTTSIIKKSNAKTFMNVNDLPRDDMVKNYKPILEDGNLELWNLIRGKVMEPSFSPLFTPDLTDLPPAYITTCQHDVLRDDGIFYAKRLRHAGVTVEHVNVNRCYHAWISFFKDVPFFEEELGRMLNYIDSKL